MSPKTWLLLFVLLFSTSLGIMGCARGEQPSWEEEKGELVISAIFASPPPSDYIYYFAIDVDENVLTGPSSDPNEWANYFTFRMENNNFYQREPGGVDQFFTGGNVTDDTVQISISLEDLGEPEIIDIMVVVTDSAGNTVDNLSRYFSMRPGLQRFYSYSRTDSSGGEVDLLRVEVEVKS
ncbi:MAG: hypothetical protein J7J32_06540 [Candidatus Atribacteria bacterium]|nr:hypothetical protein [Candidatus Atribacteria bacterium]MCD6350258.1 hypothetical protein [Candidatus Atribacteria bacterium]